MGKIMFQDREYAGDLVGAIDFFYPVGAYFETSDSNFDPNVSWTGTWVLETAGQVHVSAGTGYAVSGALTNTSDGGSPYIQQHKHSVDTQPTFSGSQDGHSHMIASDKYFLSVIANGRDMQRKSIKPGSGTAVTGVVTSATAVSSVGSTVSAQPTVYVNRTANVAVGAVSEATTGGAGNMPPYINVYRWHRTA